jgi:hypothetical protein
MAIRHNFLDPQGATVGVPILIKSGRIDGATHQWSLFRNESMPGETNFPLLNL